MTALANEDYALKLFCDSQGRNLSCSSAQALAVTAYANTERKQRQVKPNNNTFRNEPGYIYIIRANGLIKIGKSSEPDSRVKQLQTAMPYEIELLFKVQTDDMTWLERETHWALQEHRIRGEWFDVTPEQAQAAIETALPDSVRWQPWVIEPFDRVKWHAGMRMEREIKWWNWRNTSRTLKACLVCGVEDERRNMYDLEGYESFVVCQRCRDLLHDDTP